MLGGAMVAVLALSLPSLYADRAVFAPSTGVSGVSAVIKNWTPPMAGWTVTGTASASFQPCPGSFGNATVLRNATFGGASGRLPGAVSANITNVWHCSARQGSASASGVVSYGMQLPSFVAPTGGVALLRVNLLLAYAMAFHTHVANTTYPPTNAYVNGGATVYSYITDLSTNGNPVALDGYYNNGTSVGGTGYANLSFLRNLSLPTLLVLTKGDVYSIVIQISISMSLGAQGGGRAFGSIALSYGGATSSLGSVVLTKIG